MFTHDINVYTFSYLVLKQSQNFYKILLRLDSIKSLSLSLFLNH